MFAGAAREAVFSKPEVVQRINDDFVPVALKARLINNPPDGVEGRLYREISRSKPAPQGICVANSSGKALLWALSFDDDRSVLGFLDHCLDRYSSYPGSKQPVTTERYMRYPSRKLADASDDGSSLPLLDAHPEGTRCPATPGLEQGTLVGRVIGRVLDEHGKPLADTVRQEHYVEARIEVPVGIQEAFTMSLADAGMGQFRIPQEFARLLVGNAYLGQLDVNPLGGRRIGGETSRQDWEFWGRRVDSDSKKSALVHIEGKSDVAGGQAPVGKRSDGRKWSHEVQLEWEGFVKTKENRMTRLLMSARGSESLQWLNKFRGLAGENAVAHLPAGRPIDLQRDVRYGFLAEPARESEVSQSPRPSHRPSRGQDPSSQLAGVLGSRFVVFRNLVARDLELSEEQRERLDRLRRDETDRFSEFMAEFQGQSPHGRPRKIHQYRRQANERLAALLEELLTPQQSERLSQIELQAQGLFAILQPNVASRLGVSDEQRHKVRQIIEGMQRRAQALTQQAQNSRDPRKLRQQVMELRKEQEANIEELLTDTQKKTWKELTGKQLGE